MFIKKVLKVGTVICGFAMGGAAGLVQTQPANACFTTITCGSSPCDGGWECRNVGRLTPSAHRGGTTQASKTAKCGRKFDADIYGVCNQENGGCGSALAVPC